MITLVIGGTRSGKSEVAEQLAASSGNGSVVYLATGAAGDPDMAARVATHRARRPPSWTTVEEPPSLAEALDRAEGLVLVDSLGTWLVRATDDEVGAFVDALTRRADDTVVVTEEVGLSVHPPTEVGRRFADRLGEVNRRVADVADNCLLVVAGRVIELPPASPAGGGAGPAGGGATGAGPAGGGATGAGPAGGATRGGRLRGPRPGLAGLAQAVSFLTPLGRATAPGPDAPFHFPIVGAGLGLVLGLVWVALDGSVPHLILAGLLVAADLALTGMLHMDGLADSADGLLGHLPRRRRLAVMSEPQTGAFALAVVTITLWLRAAALASFAEPQPLLLASLWCASRTSMAVALGSLPYARAGGLATTMAGASALPAGILGVALTAGLAGWSGRAALAGVAAATVAAAAVHALALRRLGGFTGDTVGAAGVVGETIGLMLAAVVAS